MGLHNKVQLITYPDSLGGDIPTLRKVLDAYFKNMFLGGIHILPPYPSTGDRGFSPVTYLQIEPKFGTWEDVQTLSKQYPVMLDLMVNHISSSSEYFQNYLKAGSASRYADMFIDIRKFWPDGNPPAEDLGKIFLRRERPFSDFQVGPNKEHCTLWTTFGNGNPSDQVDVDVRSPIARELFTRIMESFAKNGVHYVRLDAVGYVVKKPGTSCFFIEPEIYDFMDWLRTLAGEHGIELLPEVHSEYETQKDLSSHGYWIYDFMLPYLILEALLLKQSPNLVRYLQDRPTNQFTQLDCHDGIPVKPDLNGFYQADQVKQVIKLCAERGGNFSQVISTRHQDADGFDVHQICGTYYSMLNQNDNAYYAARAIQLFTPGIPQIYYVGLLAGSNDMPAFDRTGDGREINRHSYSVAEIDLEVQRPIVQRLLRLINFRNTCPAFDGNCTIHPVGEHEISISWTNSSAKADLHIDLRDYQTKISYTNDGSDTPRQLL